MSKERVVIIGGDAGGMSTASQLRRLNPDAAIVVYEKGQYVSYSACGIPFYIGGVIEDERRLLARTPSDFAKNDIHVLPLHEVTAIDLAGRNVVVRDLSSGRIFDEPWDKLLIATGASRPRPPIEGADAEGIFMISTIESGTQMRSWLEAHNPRKAVVIGGGYIGLEMADTLSCMRGIETTVVEVAPQIMATLDADMASLVQRNLEEHGTRVLLGESVQKFAVRDGRVAGVVLASGEIAADVVVMALGIVPNTAIASAAGIETGIKGAIVVDAEMRTSAPGVWAAGDCVASINRITGKPIHLALGAVANKQGRTAAFSMAGLPASFPGVLGTAVCKLCGQEIARTGMLEREMTAEGREYAAGTIRGGTIASYMKDSGTMHVKLVAEMPSERIVGAQIVGDTGSAKRIDTIAAIITAGFTLEDTIGLDLSYAPPISPLWDPVQQAARYLQGKIRKNG